VFSAHCTCRDFPPDLDPREQDQTAFEMSVLGDHEAALKFLGTPVENDPLAAEAHAIRPFTAEGRQRFPRGQTIADLYIPISPISPSPRLPGI
jgi:hypothetical protein